MAISPMYVGQTGPPASFTIMTDNNTPFDLTNCTMLPPLIRNTQTNVERSGSGTWSIINASAGVAEYTWTASDTATISENVLYVRFSLNSLTYTCDPILWEVKQS